MVIAPLCRIARPIMPVTMFMNEWHRDSDKQKKQQSIKTKTFTHDWGVSNHPHIVCIPPVASKMNAVPSQWHHGSAHDQRNKQSNFFEVRAAQLPLHFHPATRIFGAPLPCLGCGTATPQPDASASTAG